jgi:hypothetical protein
MKLGFAFVFESPIRRCQMTWLDSCQARSKRRCKAGCSARPVASSDVEAHCPHQEALTLLSAFDGGTGRMIASKTLGLLQQRISPQKKALDIPIRVFWGLKFLKNPTLVRLDYRA